MPIHLDIEEIDLSKLAKRSTSRTHPFSAYQVASMIQLELKPVQAAHSETSIYDSSYKTISKIGLFSRTHTYLRHQYSGIVSSSQHLVLLLTNGSSVYEAPANAESRKKSDHIGSIICGLILHCKRLLPRLKPRTPIDHI